MADTDAKIKVQIFVLKKDTADIVTAWAQDKAESLGIASLTQTHIEKLEKGKRQGHGGFADWVHFLKLHCDY